MRFWGSGALRYVKSEERTPLERVTANKWSGQFALSAKNGHRALLLDIRQWTNCMPVYWSLSWFSCIDEFAGLRYT